MKPVGGSVWDQRPTPAWGRHWQGLVLEGEQWGLEGPTGDGSGVGWGPLRDPLWELGHEAHLGPSVLLPSPKGYLSIPPACPTSVSVPLPGAALQCTVLHVVLWALHVGGVSAGGSSWLQV